MTAAPLLPAAGPGAQALAPKPVSRDAETAKQFETMFLSQFVDEMLSTVDSSAFGGGQEMEMWRSFLSDALAESLASQGGLGLGNDIQRVLGAYRQGSAGPHAPNREG